MHLKTDKVDKKKRHGEKKVFAYFFNPLKNVVECYKEFFAYFNALETHREKASICLDL